MKKMLVAAAMASSLLPGSPAHAVPVSQWDYSVDLEWVGAEFTSGGGTTTQNRTLLSWGASGGDHRDASRPTSGSRSALEIDDRIISGTAHTNGAAAPAGTITHYNNAMRSTFAMLSAASLAATFELRPDGSSSPGVVMPLDTDFTMRLVETLNRSPCGFASSTVCDDLFILTSGIPTFSFDFDGTRYAVEIFEAGSSLLGLSEDACAVAGSDPGCVGFQTPERAFTPVSFAFAISAAELPEPDALALVSLGLLGLAGRRRVAAAIGKKA